MRVGLAGISTCGKTTIANSLKAHFGGAIFSSDDYYKEGFKYKQINLYGRNVDDWEDPESLDWNNYRRNIIMAKDQFVYVDCYVLFYDKKIVDALDCIIFIEYSPNEYEIALNRRVERLYQIPAPNDFKTNPFSSGAHQEAAYFEKIVLPFAMEHPEYYLPNIFKKDLLCLSATAPIAENIAKSIQFIDSLLSNRI